MKFFLFVCLAVNTMYVYNVLAFSLLFLYIFVILLFLHKLAGHFCLRVPQKGSRVAQEWLKMAQNVL